LSKKILIASIFYAPEKIGVSKYTTEMVEHLQSNGYTVKVITAFPFYPEWAIRPEYATQKSFFYHEVIRQVDIIRCPLFVPKPETLGFSKRIWHLMSFGITSCIALFSQVTWKPDLVIAVVPTEVYLLPVLMLSWLTRSKKWLHIQDFEIELALRVVAKRPSLGRIAISFQRRTYQCFDVISTISQTMLTKLRTEYKLDRDIYALPNWVDIADIIPTNDDGYYRKLLEIDQNQKVVLYSGNMGNKYALLELGTTARILSAVDDIIFVFCGDGASKNLLVDTVKGLKNVRFLPLQSENLLNTLLNFADIHILPQKNIVAESVLPSKMLGMLASGKPIIATVDPDSEVGAIVRQCGICTACDPNEMASAILQMVSSDTTMASLGKRGREIAAEQFDKKRILDNFVNQIQSLDKMGLENSEAKV
jgi:colanic acid biosynthesis glycosyl transferase WcaI